MSRPTNIRELIGSVLMFGFPGGSFSDPATKAAIKELKSIHCGGVILFDHDIAGNHPRNILDPKQLARLIEDLRNELGPELIVAIDQEGGFVDRLKQDRGFLPSISAAEFAQLEEIDQHQYATNHARQLQSLGINLNFAPCVDLAVDPESPIIAARERSYGSQVEQVYKCAQVVIDAHQHEGVQCCLKHFPGHGSSMIDSHLCMCDITKTHVQSETRIFEQLIAAYQSSVAVMTGHLINTDIDPKFPASLSHLHTTAELRSTLGFEGVVVTDSLDMRAIRDHFGEGESAIRAINAGADLVLDGLNAPGYREPGAPTRLFQSLYQAAEQGQLVVGVNGLEKSRARLANLMSSDTR